MLYSHTVFTLPLHCTILSRMWICVSMKRQNDKYINFTHIIDIFDPINRSTCSKTLLAHQLEMMLKSLKLLYQSGSEILLNLFLIKLIVSSITMRGWDTWSIHN